MEGVVNATPRPLYPRESDAVPIVEEAGWAPGPVGWVRKISHPPGFDLRTIQPVASRYTDYAIPVQFIVIIIIIIIVLIRERWFRRIFRKC
jgi:hypothetical protein